MTCQVLIQDEQMTVGGFLETEGDEREGRSHASPPMYDALAIPLPACPRSRVLGSRCHSSLGFPAADVTSVADHWLPAPPAPPGPVTQSGLANRLRRARALDDRGKEVLLHHLQARFEGQQRVRAMLCCGALKSDAVRPGRPPYRAPLSGSPVAFWHRRQTSHP